VLGSVNLFADEGVRAKYRFELQFGRIAELCSAWTGRRPVPTLARVLAIVMTLLRLNSSFGGDATSAADLVRYFFQIFYVI
jgi:hypothetical protein